MICGSPSEHGERLQLLQVGVSGMEPLAVQVAHGLELQGVVEASEDRIVVVANDQEDLGAPHLPVHEAADIGVDLLEIGGQIAQAVYDDGHLPLPADLLYAGEEVYDVGDLLLLPREGPESAVDLLQVVGAQSGSPRDVDVVLVLHELLQQRSLAEVAATAHRAGHGRLRPQVVEECQFLRAPNTSIHAERYASPD